jgi:coenzyme F420-reducing hydrogenase alpha subunit
VRHSSAKHASLSREAYAVGAIEAPRGILFHRYATDAAGLITAADCVIPTNQNLANIEGDMRALVPEILHKSDAEIQLRLEMLVRAYDPCISCSTHLVRL